MLTVMYTYIYLNYTTTTGMKDRIDIIDIIDKIKNKI